jgi:hypothetical protein
MTAPRKRRGIAAATAAALGVSLSAHAVHLGTEGVGQALIYPYYTVRAAGGNAFNTYLSVVNTTHEAKAVRVRLREGRAARPVLDFNLYLSPNDVWSAALVPTDSGAQLVAVDTSCTDPAFVPTGTTGQFGMPVTALPLHANAFTGTNADGFGNTLDRTREGYVEVIEMATLSGVSAAAITHNSAAVPANCAAIRAATTVVTGSPTGGLSGTLTLINVNSGQDFTLDAAALDALATRPFFRPPGDPYPDWTATEIDPVSVVLANGSVYRSEWTRPVDAVSAVLMRGAWFAEYVLDPHTNSATDVVVTLPTRHHYANASSAAAPFRAPLSWTADCGRTRDRQAGEAMPGTVFFNREEQGAVDSGGFDLANPGYQRLCAASAVASVGPNRPPSLFGSTTLGLAGGGTIAVISAFPNGWLAMTPGAISPAPFVSLPSSTRTSMLTGQATTGSHTYHGLPVVGFFARTFVNGTLSCGAGACQGNYGGAFPMRYVPGVASATP